MLVVEYSYRDSSGRLCYVGNDGVCRYRRVYSDMDLRILEMLGESVEHDFISWLEDVSYGKDGGYVYKLGR